MKVKKITLKHGVTITLTREEAQRISIDMGELYKPRGSGTYTWPSTETANLNHELVGFLNDTL